MPISREQFMEAKKPLSEKILSLLREHKEKAYTIAEIMKEIEQVDYSIILLALFLEETSGERGLREKYNLAIQELLSKDLIEKGEIGGNVYFAIKEKTL